jgi:DUF438 domain-containing protein
MFNGLCKTMSDRLADQETRKQTLKGIITDLHASEDPEHFKEVKSRFENLVRHVDPSEIPEIENELIQEGMPEHEVKRLCDVHVALFKEALAAQEVAPNTDTPPGHPVHTFMGENHSVAHVINALKDVLNQLQSDSSNSEFLDKWRAYHEQLMELDKHYLRKENLLFPYLENRGITGPPSVMWGLHDEIRAGLKSIRDQMAPETIPTVALPLLETITGLIWKEENILFPMCLENLTDDEWMSIREQSDEIGYCLFKPTSHWSPSLEKDEERPVSPTIPEGRIQLPSGSLSLKELELLFNHLPLDITFVDEDDTVIYFSEGERIFLRPRAAIGRKVQFCHPPSSLHIVNQILLDFKNGTRDVAEFWINFQEKFVHIRYFAVRDEKKRYIGTLEMTQDLTRIKALEGEKRL